MSAIRIYRDGIPDWRVIDDGACPSRSSRGIRGGIGNPVVAAYTPHVSPNRLDRVRKNPDNGAVEATITEVQT